MEYFYTYKTIIGNISIVEKNNYIIKIIIGSYQGIIKETNLIKKCYKELIEYLNKKRKYFDIPIKVEGTIFQEKVLLELTKVSYGEIITYKELARRVGNIKAVRAIGMALNKNPLLILIPCHRVIMSNSLIGGYKYGSKLKEYLLELEKNC